MSSPGFSLARAGLLGQHQGGHPSWLPSALPKPHLQRRPDAFYRDKPTSTELAERVTRGKKHPQHEGKFRQAAWGVRIPDTYKLPALRIIHSPGHIMRGPLWEKKKKEQKQKNKTSIIMAGQMGILAQLKASDPNPGAVRLDGVEVVMKGVRGTCQTQAQPARPFGVVSVFWSHPKSFGDDFWGGGTKPK